jgi:ribosomal protein L22
MSREDDKDRQDQTPGEESAAPAASEKPAAAAKGSAAKGSAAKSAAKERPAKRAEAKESAEEPAEKPAAAKRSAAKEPAAKESAGKQPAGKGSGKAPARAPKAPAPAAEPQPKPASRARAGKPAPRRRVVSAHARYVRTSARKARMVCGHLRGKSVQEARAILAFTPREVARDWSKLLESAVANAESNHELLEDDLIVREAYADEGPTIKRFQPRAMGRATPIRKRTTHLTIKLTPGS